MDIQLQGLLCSSGRSRYCVGDFVCDDNWRAEKNGNLFQVTYDSREDGPSAPLQVWVTDDYFDGPVTRTTIQPGQTKTLGRRPKNIYYIKNPEQRKQFHCYDLRTLYLRKNVNQSPIEYNLDFTWENDSLRVTDRMNPQKKGKIRVFRYNLNFSEEWELNSLNSVDPNLLTNILFLEEREGEIKWDADEVTLLKQERDELKLQLSWLFGQRAPVMEKQVSLHLRKKTNFDFHFISKDGSRIGTHRLLVEARTTLLKNEQEATSEVKVEASTGALADLAHFLIHDEAIMKNMHLNALELFELACKYDIKLLKQVCEEYFEEYKVTSENESEVEKLTCEYESLALLTALMSYRKKRKECTFYTPKSLAEDLATVGDEESEVALISRDGKEVRCPSLLLICRSKIFKKRLQLELKKCPGEKATIKVSDYDASVLEEFVHFLKTDSVQDMKTHAAQLLLLAYNYSVHKLGVVCIDYICGNMGRFTPFELFKISKNIVSPKLDSALEEKFKQMKLE